MNTMPLICSPWAEDVVSFGQVNPALEDGDFTTDVNHNAKHGQHASNPAKEGLTADNHGNNGGIDGGVNGANTGTVGKV